MRYAFGGRVMAQGATAGQSLIKQADGSWAGGIAATGDLTEVQVGSGLSVASGTGPIPIVSLDADLATIAGLARTRGDILVADSTPAWSLLAHSTAGKVLISGTDTAWSDVPTVTELIADWWSSSEASDADVAAFQAAGSYSASNTIGHLLTNASRSLHYAACSATAANGAYITATRHRGTLASPTVTAQGDAILQIGGRCATGSGASNAEFAAAILMFVDGTPGSTDAPGAIDFQTALDGTNTLLTRMRIKNSGLIDIGTNGLVGGSSIGANTARLVRSGTGWAIDDGAAGAATLAITGNLTLTSPLLLASGGLGFTSGAVGDLLYLSGTTTPAKLADVATGQVLVSGGVNTAPGWLAAGTSGQFLKTLGSGSNPTWATVTGDQPFMVLKAIDAKQPVSGTFPDYAVRNGHGVLQFDDGTAVTTDDILWENCVMPASYAAGTITVTVYWIAATATSGDVVWGGKFEAMAGTDLDADSFASAQTATGTANGTSGIITATTLTFTQAQADAIAAGGSFRFFLYRDSDAGGDTMSGDAQVLCASIKE